MSLTALIIGVILQSVFALLQFEVIHISAAKLLDYRSFRGSNSIENWVSRANQQDWISRMLTACRFVLPALSVAVSIVLIYMYITGSPNISNWWHAIPILTFAVYLKFIGSLFSRYGSSGGM